MIKEKAYVIHVHGKKELPRTTFAYELLEDGNLEDLSDGRLISYFAGELLNPPPNTFCAFKHLLAYENIVKNRLPYACIVEDELFPFNMYHNRRYLSIYNSLYL